MDGLRTMTLLPSQLPSSPSIAPLLEQAGAGEWSTGAASALSFVTVTTLFVLFADLVPAGGAEVARSDGPGDALSLCLLLDFDAQVRAHLAPI
jgi:hypothetical protein